MNDEVSKSRDESSGADIDALFHETPPPSPHEPPPASPSISEASSVVSVSKFRSRKNKLWRSITPFTPAIHGGQVVKETPTVIFKVPEAAPTESRETNIFGEPVKTRARLSTFKPVSELSESALKNRMCSMLNLVRQEELKEGGGDVSNLVVKLHVSCETRMPAEGTRVIKEGKRLSTIPILPPFEAFTGGHAVRSSLKKPVGDNSREFPLPVSVKYISGKPTIRTKELLMPTIQGLDYVGDYVDALETTFTVKSVKTDPNQFCNIQLTALTVHKFNCNAKELVEISGATLGSDKPLPPVCDKFSLGHINSSSFLDNWRIKPDQQLSGHDQEILDEFIKILTGMELPPRDKALPDNAGIPWASCTEEVCDRLATFVLAARPRLREISNQASPAASKHILCYLIGYVTWRYFYLPDLVLACCSIDYLALHPRATPLCVYVDCPGPGIRATQGHEEFNKRVTFAPYTNDPSGYMLFMHFHHSFDVYGASLILYKLICERKCHILDLREKIRAAKIAKKRAEADSNGTSPGQDEEESEKEGEDDETPKDACKGASKGSVRTAKVRRRRYIAIPELLEDIDPEYQGAKSHGVKYGSTPGTIALLNKFVERVLEDMNELYRWKRYPMLCNPFADRRSEVASKRKAEKGQLNEEEVLAKKPEEAPKKPKKEPPPPDSPMFEAALYKSMALGKVVALLPRERAPIEMKKHLERALEIFESSFKIIGEKTAAKLGFKAYLDHPRFTAAVELIYQFMLAKGVMEEKNKDTPELKYVVAFILANRADCPEVLYYRHMNQQITYRFVENTEIYKWYLESKTQYEESKKKEAAEKEERRRQREERQRKKQEEREKKMQKPSPRKEESSSSSESESSSSSEED